MFVGMRPCLSSPSCTSGEIHASSETGLATLVIGRIGNHQPRVLPVAAAEHDSETEPGAVQYARRALLHPSVPGMALILEVEVLCGPW